LSLLIDCAWSVVMAKASISTVGPA
jgi:hypothetical protein